jgi:RNA methyltransferase, TrmH family
MSIPETSEHHIRSLSGKHNPLLKELRFACTRGLTENDCFVAEGVRMIEEAVRSGVHLNAIFFSESARAPKERLLSQISKKVDVVELPDKLFREVVDTESPQGVAALVERRKFVLDDVLLQSPQPLLVVAAGLQDPGNLGTLIRSAEAFGASGVLIGEGTVGPFNPKSIRATAGSIFRVPLVEGKLKDFVAALRERAITLVATSSHKGTPVTTFDFRRSVAVFVGNEGAGLPHELLRQIDELVSIPQAPEVESLNAGVAASVVLYEASRQRGVKP